MQSSGTCVAFAFTVIVFGSAGSGLSQDRADNIGRPTPSAQPTAIIDRAGACGIWIHWRELDSGQTAVRDFHCPQTDAPSIVKLTNRLNRTETCSGVTIWMETLDADILSILATVQNLESLAIVGSTFRAGSLRELRQCSTLKFLHLDGSGVGDAACAELSGIESLEDLQLAGSAVTDEGLKHLGSIRTLRELDLRGTRISDAGLTWLQKNHALRLLDVRGTAVTPAGVRRLTRILPSVRIHFREANRAAPNLAVR
jgi:hypothetical protein